MRMPIVALFVFVFALIGGVAFAIALSGINVVLPGLGLVITGAFFGLIAGVFLGAIFGLIVGYIVSRLLPTSLRNCIPKDDARMT